MLKGSEMGGEVSGFLGRLFKGIPLHPNLITLGAVAFALLGYLAYANYQGWLSFGLFVLAFVVDAIDGAVARAKGMESRKGAFIDGVCDRLVEFLLILALFGAPIPILIMQKHFWLLGVLFFGTGMTSFVKAYAEHTEVLHHARAVRLPGMLERAERSLLLMGVFFLVLAGSEYSGAVLMFTAVLSFLTFVERVARVLSSKDE